MQWRRWEGFMSTSLNQKSLGETALSKERSHSLLKMMLEKFLPHGKPG